MVASRLSAKVGFAIVAGVTLVASSAAADPVPPPVIAACRGKVTGYLRVPTGSGGCTQLETPISWNVQGPAGPAGPGGGDEQVEVEVTLDDGDVGVPLHSEPGVFDVTASCRYSSLSLGAQIQVDNHLPTRLMAGRLGVAPNDSGSLTTGFGDSFDLVIGYDAGGGAVRRDAFVNATSFYPEGDQCTFIFRIDPT